MPSPPPSPRGRGGHHSLSLWERAGVRVVVVQPVEYLHQDSISFNQRLSVGEAKNMKAELLQCVCTQSIRLNRVRLEMLPAV
jgi:hypothetical protein